MLLDALPVSFGVPSISIKCYGSQGMSHPVRLTCAFRLVFQYTKKGRSHPAPVRRIKGIDPLCGTIPHDNALGSSDKYLDQCHRQSKSVLSDQGSAEAPHSGSDRFHPIDLRLC